MSCKSSIVVRTIFNNCALRWKMINDEKYHLYVCFCIKKAQNHLQGLLMNEPKKKKWRRRRSCFWLAMYTLAFFWNAITYWNLAQSINILEIALNSWSLSSAIVERHQEPNHIQSKNEQIPKNDKVTSIRSKIHDNILNNRLTLQRWSDLSGDWRDESFAICSHCLI